MCLKEAEHQSRKAELDMILARNALLHTTEETESTKKILYIKMSPPSRSPTVSKMARLRGYSAEPWLQVHLLHLSFKRNSCELPELERFEDPIDSITTLVIKAHRFYIYIYIYRLL